MSAALGYAFMSERERKINVMIIEDHLVVREGLAILIGQKADMAICASVGGAEEAMAALAEARPDVIILDLALGHTTGLDLIVPILSQQPGVKILVLSMHHERLYAERVLRMGASGYIMKSEGHAKVVEGIREVMAGHTYVSAAIRDQLWHSLLGQGREEHVPGNALTDRELEVFHLLGQGLTTQQIAESLQISGKTVQTYRNHIKEKLHIRNAAELMQQATLWAHDHPPPPPSGSPGE